MTLTEFTLCNDLVNILMETVPDTRLSTDKDKEEADKGIFAGMEYLGLSEDKKPSFVKCTDSTKYQKLVKTILDKEILAKRLLLGNQTPVEGFVSDYFQSEKELYSAITLGESYESQIMDIFRANVVALLHYTQHNTSMSQSLTETIDDLKEGFGPDLVEEHSASINDDYDALIARVTRVVEVLYACDKKFSMFKNWNEQNNSGLDYHLREELETKFKDVKKSLMDGKL